MEVCKLYPARCGRAEDVMTDGLSTCAQQVLVVDILQLDTKLVTTTEGNKLFGLVYKNMVYKNKQHSTLFHSDTSTLFCFLSYVMHDHETASEHIRYSSTFSLG